MPGRPDARTLAVAGLHLAALWAFAVAQPWFDVVGSTPAFFAVRGSEPVDIVAFAAGLVLLPPLAMVAVEALAGLAGPRPRAAVHLTFLAVLVAVVAVQALEQLTGSGSSRVLLPLAAAVAVAAASAYARSEAVRSVLTVLAPAPVLFLALFLLASPVTKLVTGGRDGAGVVQADSRTPVVLVVFDELPVTSLLRADGRIDAARYPNFAALGRTSTWYRDTATTDSGTIHAVPAILDGRWPRKDTVPTVADHPRNLFTLLGASHRVHASEAVTSLCPSGVCRRRDRQGFGGRMRSLVSDARVVAAHLVLPDDLRTGLPSVGDRWEGFGDVDPVASGTAPPARRGASASEPGFGERFAAAESGRLGLVRRFADGIRPWGGKGRPPLHFLHAMFPHSPWQYLPSGRQYGAAMSRLGQSVDGWAADPFGPLMFQQRHLLQAQFTDRLLGRVLARLRRARLFDRALVVVVADHGISFTPGQRPRGGARVNMPDVLPVPLLVKAPRQRTARTVRAQIRTVDILPTIADLLGIRIPWRVDGRSALRARGDRPIRMYVGGEDPRRVDAGWLRARRAERLRRQVARFGQGDARPGLYGLGPHPELLGRPAQDVAVRRAAHGGTIDQAAELARVRPGSGFVPAHVTGEVPVGGGPPTDLALALNGRIAAVSRTVAGAGGQFSFLVPDGALRAGANRAQVLAVPRSGRGELTLLADTRGVRPAYALAAGAIRRADGRRIRIAEQALGAVSLSQRQGQIVQLGGWAVDARRRRPVERVLVFAGDTLLADTRPREFDAAAGELFDVAPFELGWRADVTNGALRRAGGAPRVFAVARGVASPLTFSCPGNRPPAPGCPRLELHDGSISAGAAVEARIARGGLEGLVDGTRVRGRDLVVRGWALRSADRRPVERIVGFAGERFLFSGPPTVPRPDVGAARDADPTRLGFEFRVPSRLAEGAGRPRVYAIAGGMAVPLRAAR